MIGDSLAQKMFSSPLLQNLTCSGRVLKVVGVCLDPINNGNVTYIPLRTLQNITGISNPNILMVRINPSANRVQVLNTVKSELDALGSDSELKELNQELDRTAGFLGYIWSMIMFLPTSVLTAATLCLISYVVLSVDEQRQEFGILRAVGAKPRTIVRIVSIQNILVLLSSYAVGLCLGIIVTLLILIPEPVVTDRIIMEIAGWLLMVPATIFVVSLLPVVRFSRKPILEMLKRS